MKRNTRKRKRIKKQRVIALIAAAAIVIIAVSLLVVQIINAIYGMTNKEEKVVKTDYSAHVVSKPDITVDLLTINENSRPAIKLEQINGVVIHYTANPGTSAKANRDYFESRKDMPDESQYKVSSHFIIGIDGTIIQCIPLKEISYASNNRNSDTVSIECCHPTSNGKFSKRTYSSLIKLTGWLCNRYHIDKSNIIRHYDVTGKLCPLYYVKHEKAWTALKNNVEKYILSCPVKE